MALRLRRGTDAERLLVTPLEGELIYTTDTKILYIGDGTTQGGLQVTGAFPESIDDLNDVDIASIVPEVGQTLKWNGEEFIPGDFILDQEANVNIVADDSTVLVNTDTKNFQGDTFTGNTFTGGAFSGTFNGTFVGDGSGLTNLPIAEDGSGIVEGSNYRINIAGDDSTVLVDVSNNTFTGNVNSNFIYSNDPIITLGNINNDGNKIEINGLNDSESVVINGISSGDIIDLVGPFKGPTLKINSFTNTYQNPQPNTKGNYLFSISAFGKNQNNNDSRSAEIYFVVDQEPTNDSVPGGLIIATTSVSNDTNVMIFDSEGRLGINTVTPTENLDVVGNAKISGSVTAGSFIGSIFTDDSSELIDAINGRVYGDHILPVYTVTSAGNISNPVTGMVIFVTDGDSSLPCLAVYDGSSFRRISLGSAISST